MINDLFETLFATAKIETKGGKFNQTQRNTLKTQLVDNIMENIEQNDNVRVGLTDKGIVVECQNSELGSICFGIDLTIKAYDYDFDNQTQAYRDYKKGVEDRKAEKTRQKELKIASDKKIRAEKLQAQMDKLGK